MFSTNPMDKIGFYTDVGIPRDGAFLVLAFVTGRRRGP